MSIKIDHDRYMNVVGQKLNAAMNDIQKKGTRNTQGLQFSLDRIRTSAENLWFQMGNDVYDACGAMFKAFSERPGLSNVGNVAGVDVIDINIAATQQSVLGYLTAERGMEKPIDTLWFQGLNAINSVGGYSEGQSVFHPFTPIGKEIRSALKNTFTKTVEAAGNVEVGAPVAPKTVSVTAFDADGEQIATGIDNGKGQIMWTSPDVGATTVDYVTGIITVGAFTGDVKKVAVVAEKDKTVERDGANTLKVKPATTTINLVAEPRRIQLNQSWEDTSYMNKQAFNLSKTGVDMDYSKIAVNQLLHTFVQFLDFDVVKTTAEVMLKQPEVDTLDLTDYVLTTSQANTKNDVVNQYILKLNKHIQQSSNKGMTALLVDSEAAVVLGNNPMYFVANPAFDQNLDGMVGTYRGIPVIRHHMLDGILDDDSGATFGFIGGLFKDPSGVVAPTVYGEYLSPYSITPALNYDNPAQYSSGLYSMSATAPLIENLCGWLKVVIAK